MDLDISMRTVDCFYTVTFYGALFREVTAICRFLFWPLLFFTECLKFFLFSPRLLPYVLPGRCMDLHGADGHVPGQVLQEGDREGPDHPRGHPGEDRRLCECRNIRLSTSIPWPAGELTLSLQIVKALEHLHSNLQVIHRGETVHLTVCLSTCLSSLYLNLLFVVDVKPSNVLINTQGQVKMCDFGISGYLVDSVAKTMDAGCKPYMAVSSTERFSLHFNLVFMSRKQEE